MFAKLIGVGVHPQPAPDAPTGTHSRCLPFPQAPSRRQTPDGSVAGDLATDATKALPDVAFPSHRHPVGATERQTSAQP